MIAGGCAEKIIEFVFKSIVGIKSNLYAFGNFNVEMRLFGLKMLHNSKIVV